MGAQLEVPVSAAVTVGPGDTLVIGYQRLTTLNDAERARERIQQLCPALTPDRVLIVGGVQGFAVVQRQQQDPVPVGSWGWTVLEVRAGELAGITECGVFTERDDADHEASELQARLLPASLTRYVVVQLVEPGPDGDR